jgi:thiamine biosynthesis lipoprotein
MMGTFIEVISPDRRASGIAFKEARRVENLLSKYDQESDIARLNRQGEARVSPETMYVIRKAKGFWLASGGAFDITVGPLVDLWGFTDKQFRLPGRARIKKTLRRVGMQKIIFADANSVVKFEVPGMKIDLGGVAKGYAVDCAAAKLKEAGINNFLINLGGQIYACGDNFGKPWIVALRDPSSGGLREYFTLKDKAVSTSGNYEQFFKIAGHRYGHIIDPETGYPANRGLASVTVVAPDGLTCDALSTAIFVLGNQKIEALKKRFPGIQVKVIPENP